MWTTFLMSWYGPPSHALLPATTSLYRPALPLMQAGKAVHQQLCCSLISAIASMSGAPSVADQCPQGYAPVTISIMRVILPAIEKTWLLKGPRLGAAIAVFTQIDC